MSIEKLQEVTSKKLTAHDHIETRLSWCNTSNYLAANIEHGIYLMKLNQNVESFSKKVELIDSLLEAPKISPLSTLLQIKKPINNLNLTEMFMEPAFWPHNKDLSQVTYFSYFEWSPKQFTYNSICLLATVTNTGCVEVYGCNGRGWASLLKLTDILFSSYDLQKKPKDFENLYSIVKEMKTTAICWGGTTKHNKTCYFVTAQGNGDILFWTLEKTQTSLTPNLVLKYNTSSTEILHLHWLQLNSEKVLLIYSNVFGEIFSLNCSLNKDQVVVNESQTLWKYKDRIVVKNIVYTRLNGKLVMVFSKLRHLLAIMFNDKQSQIVSECNINPVDEKIVDLCVKKDKIYFATEYCNLYNLKLSLIKSEINLSFSQIVISDMDVCNIHSMAVSENSVILATAVASKKYHTERVGAQFMNIRFYIAHNENTIFDIITKNPIQKINNVSDCIEVLRYLVIKNNVLPALDYDKFYAKAKDNVYLLKVFLILFKMFNIIEPYLYRNSLHTPMPVTIESVQDLLLLKQAQTTLSSILKKHKTNKLSQLDFESLAFVKDFLSFYSKKYNCNINEFENVNIYDVIQLKHPSVLCQCCSEKYDGRWYGSSHINMLCSLTFTPINDIEYLSCPNCYSIARVEMFSNEPVCVFCDTFLIKS